MEGRLCSLDPEQKRGKVDTRNDEYGLLTIYFKTIPPDLKVGATVEFNVTTSRFGNLYAIFVSVVKRNKAQFNTEDRGKWYIWGEEREKDFISIICQATGRDIRINPDKAKHPWAIDLYDYTAMKPADLKTQRTPFFMAGKYWHDGFRYNPAFTVTFNRKDFERYKENYPLCDIYFWVDWKQCKYDNITIPHVCGVWRASFPEMAKKIQDQKVALHSYMHRKDDDHNAKDSFLFDLRDCVVFERIL